MPYKRISHTCENSISGQEENPPVRRPMDIKYLQRQIRYYNDMKWLWKPGYIM